MIFRIDYQVFFNNIRVLILTRAVSIRWQMLLTCMQDVFICQNLKSFIAEEIYNPDMSVLTVKVWPWHHVCDTLSCATHLCHIIWKSFMHDKVTALTSVWMQQFNMPTFRGIKINCNSKCSIGILKILWFSKKFWSNILSGNIFHKILHVSCKGTPELLYIKEAMKKTHHKSVWKCALVLVTLKTDIFWKIMVHWYIEM